MAAVQWAAGHSETLYARSTVPLSYASIIAPDQITVLRKGEMRFELKDAALHATNVMVFGQIEFKTAGTYFVEVLVDDVMKLRYPIPVIHTPPPEQNPPPTPPESPEANPA